MEGLSTEQARDADVRARAATAFGRGRLGAHPGIARTELFANGPGTNHAINLAIKVFGPIFSQSAEAGALPSILAATDPAAKPGAYYGSIGFMDAKGPPGLAKIMPHALDKQVAAALWDKAVLLTGAHAT